MFYVLHNNLRTKLERQSDSIQYLWQYKTIYSFYKRTESELKRDVEQTRRLYPFFKTHVLMLHFRLCSRGIKHMKTKAIKTHFTNLNILKMYPRFKSTVPFCYILRWENFGVFWLFETRVQQNSNVTTTIKFYL